MRDEHLTRDVVLVDADAVVGEVERHQALTERESLERGHERLDDEAPTGIDMIEEYARHTGHADLIREAIHGRVGGDPPA